MVSPRRRVVRTATVTLLVLAWIGILALVSTGSFRVERESVFIASTPPLCANLALLLLLTSEWKASMKARNRRKSPVPGLEVIPIERWKPPGLETRKSRGPVVIVHRRHIRVVERPSLVHQKRRALGLPERPPFGLNRRRSIAWHRRIVR